MHHCKQGQQSQHHILGAQRQHHNRLCTSISPSNVWHSPMLPPLHSTL
eukprot:CCRYP_005683-RA/>CCRYP_005683-RA protein AED:0.43 eAED:1.00 QI:0/-1/0/1/-1/0/1/0/47